MLMNKKYVLGMSTKQSVSSIVKQIFILRLLATPLEARVRLINVRVHG